MSDGQAHTPALAGAAVGTKVLRGDQRLQVASAKTDAGTAETERGYDTLMKAQADALNQITKQVIVPGPRARDTLEQTLAKVEARLAVTEQSVTAIEQRFGEKLKGLDVDTNALAERMHGLRQRLEKFEEKQTSALAQLRLEVFNISHPNAGEAKISTAPSPMTDDDLAVLQMEKATQRIRQSDEPRPDAIAGTYLDSARKAAIDAAEKAAAEPVKPKSQWHKGPWRKFWVKRRWAMLTAAAVMVVWFDAYVFAHYQPAEGAIAAGTAVKATPRDLLIRGTAYLKAKPSDPAKAKTFIAQAAAAGDPAAENLMGDFAQSAKPANLKTAAGWYEKAARHGNVKAMTNLAMLYAGGWPDGTDFSKAASWFEKAASFGEVDAAFDLAILYERGQGVRRDVAKAYHWYGIAAASGDNHAATRASALSGQFSRAKQEEMNAAIADFAPDAPNAAANFDPGKS